MEEKQFFEYLNEIKELSKIILSDYGNVTVDTLNDYQKLLVHLNSFSKYKGYTKNLMNFDSIERKGLKLREISKMINDFKINSDLILNYNNNFSNCFVGITNELEFNDSNIHVNNLEVFDKLTNINDITRDSFNLVKDRITISDNYSIKGTNGHSVSFKGDIMPCVFVRDRMNSLYNYVTLSHEFGHVVDHLTGINKYLTNNNYFNELYSVLFEFIFIDLMRKEYKDAGNLASKYALNTYCNHVFNQNVLYYYIYMTSDINIDEYTKRFNVDLSRLDNKTRKILEVFDTNSIKLDYYPYIFGSALALSMIEEFNGDYNYMIKEYRDLVDLGSIKDINNLTNFNKVDSCIKRLIR